MISIKSKINEDLIEWYCDRMLSIIQSSLPKKIGIASPKFLKEIYEGLKSLEDKKVLCDLLIMPIEELKKKYFWIQNYSKLCDIYVCMKNFDKDNTIKDEEKFKIINEQIQECNNMIYIQECAQKFDDKYPWINFEEVPKTKNQYMNLQKQIKKILDKVNKVINKYIDYNVLMCSEIRRELLERMDVSVCPYCNRVYTHNFRYIGKNGKEETMSLADLDHFLPKSIYALFSLSIWNFVPSCKVCNQLLKKAETTTILSPLEAGFDDDCIYTLEIDTNSGASLLGFGSSIKGKWVVQPKAKNKEKINNNIKMFKLNEQYNFHQNMIPDILRKRYITTGYVTMLQDFLREKNRDIPELTIDDLNRLVYGVSLNPEKYSDELFSKMIKDIVERQ